VRADRTRLKQVLLNLLANAIKYNHPGGKVQLRCRVDGDQVQLEVHDTGPGLSVEQQSRLFQPFERLGAERGAIEGSGIGLLLSRQLVEAMSGRIGLDSVVGRGSVFWLRLPGQARQPAATGGDRVPVAATAAQAVGVMTVLYVDDNPVNLMLVQAMLDTEPGVRTLVCLRSPDALDLARRERPDLVLLDIHMPELNGHQVLAQLRAEPLTAGVPVVAVSADADPQAIDRARAGGFVDYLTKPVDMQALLATLDRWRQR
jgi:CheY-like chemotaxis protein